MDIEAGRELDARIAVVLGLTIIHRAWPCYTPPDGCTYEAAIDGNDRSWGAVLDIVYQVREPHKDWRDKLGLWCAPVPFYSANIAAAWPVVEKAQTWREDRFMAFCKFLYDHGMRDGWGSCWLLEKSASEAAALICCAALEALGS